MKEYMVRLTNKAQQQLLNLSQAGKRSVRLVRQALILLKSDEGLSDEELVEHVDCRERTVRSVHKRSYVEGFERAVDEIALCDHYSLAFPALVRLGLEVCPNRYPKSGK
jgi:hypothetical protein